MYRSFSAVLLLCASFLWAGCASDKPASGPTRNFPEKALRGAVVFGTAPEIQLNGRPARLAPGSRIRDANNMSIVPGGLVGNRFLVNYTTDLYGLVKDVWILTPSEASRRPWPTSREEADKLIFDPAGQAWSKR